MKSQNNEWLKDYEDFLKTDVEGVPQEVSAAVFSKIQKLISPSALVVFLKVLGLHIITGFLSLSICFIL